MQKTIMLMTALLIAIAPNITADEKEKDAVSTEQQIEMIKALAPGMAVVEYTLHYDKGQPPQGADVSYMCPNCSRPHTRRVGESLIKEERPLEEAGFLVGAKSILTRDTSLEARFIKSIRVRFEDQIINAKISGYATEHNAVFLELESAPKNIKPFKFTKSKEKPAFSLLYNQVNALWSTSIQPFGGLISVTPSISRDFMTTIPAGLIVDKEGNPQGIAMDGVMPIDDSWKGSPAKWKTMPIKKFNKHVKDLEDTVNNAIVRVSLNFRSPKADGNNNYSRRSYMSRDRSDTQSTQERGVGVCIDNKTILVMIDLAAETTARLDNIRVHTADGKEREAKFVGSLNEFGVIVISVEEPMKQTIKLAKGDPVESMYKLLLKARINVVGEEYITHFSNSRILGASIGYKNKVYPTLNSREDDAFLFNLDNELMIMPMSIREKISLRNNSRWRDTESGPMPVRDLAAMLTNIDENIDPNNSPLSEDEESKIAWLGVVMQEMNLDLARANHCMEHTKNGESGALVTYVYPDSPAARAGITQGMILLRLNVEGEPKPVAIKVEDSGRGGNFRWDQLDQMPIEYFERMPAPWPSIKNNFTTLLSGIGFDKKYTIEIFNEGKEITKQLVVKESPRHFESAEKYKSETLGLTVRNLTPEVRHYMQKKTDDPGIVISKMEPGSKAAVAGIKPYEVITKVNGKTITNVKDFEKAVSEGDEFDFSINRMTLSRQVRIKLKDNNN
jgi:serine protease Do